MRVLRAALETDSVSRGSTVSTSYITLPVLAAQSTRHQYNLGSIPACGFGFYLDFDTAPQFTTAIAAGRCCLFGLMVF